MNVREILEQVTKENASDLFVVAGRPLTYKANGMMHIYSEERMMPDSCHAFIEEIYHLADNRDITHFKETGDDDFSFAIPGVSRFRVNAYKQRGSFSAVIRIITFTLPKPDELMIPQSVMELASIKKGLVLVTGPAGSGKSTTLACLIDRINSTEETHIITLEDPLEFLHSHKKSIVSQREICTDTENYLTALRASLRQSPDVILLGEMRDYETINTAMTAAETGHLIFSTLHTIGAASTIDRIIDAFPASQQRQVSILLSMVLQAIVSQALLPSTDGRMIPAFEIMVMTPAIRNLIRDLGKDHTVIFSSHILSEVQTICDRILIIAGGKLIAFDKPENLEKQLLSREIVLVPEGSAEEAAETVKGLEHVTEVQVEYPDGGHPKIHVRTDLDDLYEMSGAIFHAFAAKDQTLLEMTLKKANLEDVFLELTNEENNGNPKTTEEQEKTERFSLRKKLRKTEEKEFSVKETKSDEKEEK